LSHLYLWLKFPIIEKNIGIKMNNYIVDNNSKIFSQEKNVIDIVKEKLSFALENNFKISIYFLFDLVFFDSFKLILDDLQKLYDSSLLGNISIILGHEEKLTNKEFIKKFKNDACAIDQKALKFLEILTKADLLKIKFLLEKRLFAKIMIFSFDDKVEFWSGSTQFSDSKQNQNIELLTLTNIDKETDHYMRFYENICNISTEKINLNKVFDLIKEASKEESFFLSQKEFIAYMLKIMEKEYLVKNIGADLSSLSEFQNMSYYTCLEKLKNYSCAFLLNTAGIGKTNIACMVSKHYKDNDKKVLILYSPSDYGKWKNALKKYGVNEKEVSLVSRLDLYEKKIKFEDYFGIDLLVIEDSQLFKNFESQNNLSSNFENILRINSNCNCLFLTSKPYTYSIQELINILKIITKGNFVQKLKNDEFLKKFINIEKQIDGNAVNFEFYQIFEQVLSTLSVNITLKDVVLYYKDLPLRNVEKTLFTQVKYAYDHEIYAKIFDKLSAYLNDISFEYIDLINKVYHNHDKLYYKWKVYKTLESSTSLFRLTLKNILEKNNIIKNFFTGNIASNLSPFFKQEHYDNVKNNIETLDEATKNNSIAKIEKDIKTIESLLANIEQVRYLENRDDKITNILKILKTENKPTIIFSESKETAIYIERRLKEYGSFKIETSYNAGVTFEDNDDAVINEVDREKIRKSFEEEEFDVLIATDILDENIVFPRAEIIINFDLTHNINILSSRFNKLAKLKKSKVFNLQPEKRIDKESEIFEKLNFKMENIFSIMGLEFVNWLINVKEIKDFSNENLENILFCISEYKNLVSSKNPEEFQSSYFIESLNNDIILREFIKNFNISEDTIKLTSDTYKKPVYTIFKSDREFSFAFVKIKDVLHKINELKFSNTGTEKPLNKDNFIEINKQITDVINENSKDNFEKDLFPETDQKDSKHTKIGIIRYITDES